jgi:methyl-accepting chemotaxis protein
MLKFRSISVRVVAAIVLTVAGACGTLAAFSIMQQRSLTKLALDQELQVQYDSVIAAIDYEAKAAMAVSATMASTAPAVDAILKGDRDATLALLGPPLEALKPLGFQAINLTLPPATLFFRVHDPKAFGDDVSARRKTVVKANTEGIPISGVERGRDTLLVFGMTPVKRDGKSRFVIDVGLDLGQKFADGIKKRFGVDVAVHAYDGGAFQTLAATFPERSTASVDQIKQVFSGTPLRTDVEIGGHPAAVHLGVIKNYAGEAVAVLEIVKDTTLYEAARSAALRNQIFATVAILLIGGLVALLLGRSLSRPVSALTATMNLLSSGDTSIAIPGRDRADELGTMAKAVEVFR